MGIVIRDPGHRFTVHVSGSAFNAPENLFPPTEKGKAAAYKEACRKDGMLNRRVGASYQLARVFEWITVNGIQTEGKLLGYVAVRSGDMGFRYCGPNYREYAFRKLQDSHADARTAAERDADYAKSVADFTL